MIYQKPAQNIDKHPVETKIMVHTAAGCGLWIKNHLTEAASLVSKYWNQPKE
jgi:hypothetical protein